MSGCNLGVFKSSVFRSKSSISTFMAAFFLVFGCCWADLPEGFTPIFNGVDFTGWDIIGGTTGTWAVQDGLIRMQQSSNAAGWLQYQTPYRNFSVAVEWKAENNANSGVFLRVPNMPDITPVWDAIEIQICDDDNYTLFWQGYDEKEISGALYGIIPTNPSVYLGTNQWHSFVITCVETNIRLEYNGVEVFDIETTDYDQPFFMWNQTRKSLAERPMEGHIGLQSHNGDSRVWFRNVGIKPICTPLSPDITGEGEVSIADLAEMVAWWLETDCCDRNACGQTDLDASGTVDSADFAMLAGTWLDSLLPAPIACYDFEGTAENTCGAAYNGTLKNGATANGVLNLDGLDDFMEIPNIMTGSWTVAFDLKTQDIGTGTNKFWFGKGLVNAEIGGCKNDFGLALRDGKVHAGIGKNADCTPEDVNSSIPVNDGQWHHIAVTRDSSAGLVQIYIDGTLNGSGARDPGLKNDPARICIGSINENADKYLTGQIDNLKIWDTVLTADQIGRLP